MISFPCNEDYFKKKLSSCPFKLITSTNKVVCAIEAIQQTILCSRSRSIEQNIQSIPHGGSYFELVRSHGANAPGLFSFERNLVHVL